MKVYCVQQNMKEKDTMLAMSTNVIDIVSFMFSCFPSFRYLTENEEELEGILFDNKYIDKKELREKAKKITISSFEL